MADNAHPTASETARVVKITPRLAQLLLSREDRTLRQIETALRPFKTTFSQNAEGLRVDGAPIAAELAQRMLEALCDTRSEEKPDIAAIAAEVIAKGLQHDYVFRLTGLSRPLRALSLSQAAFLDVLLNDPHELIFGLGPTGCGKTHIAIAAGLHLLAKEQVKSVVVTRPHIAGEGETAMHLRRDSDHTPQLTSVTDELNDLLGAADAQRLTESGRVQVLPLGLLRGRTFNDTFLLVDDAQNLTARKMRMALTRIGRNSRTVVTGNLAHVDLQGDDSSGLRHVLRLIAGADLAHVFEFEPQHVIRNPLVARIESLYERNSADAP